MAKETWLDAAEAVELGFADRLAEPVRIAARFDVGRFRNAPPALVEPMDRRAEDDDRPAEPRSRRPPRPDDATDAAAVTGRSVADRRPTGPPDGPGPRRDPRRGASRTPPR